MKVCFEGRNVVVTGGTGALGSAVVENLVESGARCWIPVYHSREGETFSVRNHDRVTIVNGVDLTSELDVLAFYADLPELWASVHCVGGFAMLPFHEFKLDDLENLFSLNVATCFLCCRHSIDRMSADMGGRIVNVAARVALEPRLGAGMVPYVACKAAVAALTQSLGEEVVSRKILVNAVVPSIMDTEPNRAAMPDADFDAWPKVSEVAATVTFLASAQNLSTRSSVVPVYGAS